MDGRAPPPLPSPLLSLGWGLGKATEYEVGLLVRSTLNNVLYPVPVAAPHVLQIAASTVTVLLLSTDVGVQYI
jgi:hypothetical protein